MNVPKPGVSIPHTEFAMDKDIIVQAIKVIPPAFALLKIL
jgi:hypothetical protein